MVRIRCQMVATVTDDGYIRNNPTDGVMAEIKRSHNWEKPKRHALTLEEQNAFISFVAQSDTYKHWLPLFTVFLGTGCRTIPMLDEVYRALLREKEMQMIIGFNTAEIDGYSGFIFTNRNGYVHNPMTINRAIQRIYKEYNHREQEMAKKEK